MSASHPATGSGDFSVRHLLRVAVPMMIAMGSVGIKLFADRLMLTHYDTVAIKASMPAGILYFTIISLLMGLVSYTQTVIAHYHGAQRPKGIGQALRAGTCVAVIGGLAMMSGWLWSPWLFSLIDHDPAVQAAEVSYFNILCFGAPLALLTLSASTFWSGRGQTMTTMIVGIITALVNIAFNYWFIFGGLGITEMGINGAALGTISSDCVALAIYIVLLCRSPLGHAAGVWLLRWPAEELRRLIRFGLPAGLHRSLDLAAFTIFVQIVGRYPTTESGASPQEAANITFAINGLAFIPTMGIGTAVGILCGQAMGAGKPLLARRMNLYGIALATCIQFPAVIVYWFFPDLILQFFVRGDDPTQFATLLLAREFLGYIAIFLLCDGVWMITGSALSGVGDTRFLLFTNVSLAWLGFVLPLIILTSTGASIASLWWLMVGWGIVGAAILAVRWSTSRWQHHQVIEPHQN